MLFQFMGQAFKRPDRDRRYNACGCWFSESDVNPCYFFARSKARNCYDKGKSLWHNLKESR